MPTATFIAEPHRVWGYIGIIKKLVMGLAILKFTDEYELEGIKFCV